MNVRQVIDALEKEQGGSLTSTQLAEKFGFSVRTALRCIQQAQDESAGGGFEIRRQREGYSLVVTDSARFSHYRALTARDGDVAMGVARWMLEHKTCKIDELASQFHYSRSTVSRLLPEAERLLEPYGLSVSRKPYVGIEVLGDEVAIRNCIYALNTDPSGAPRSAGSLPAGMTSAALQAKLVSRLNEMGYVNTAAMDQRFLAFLMIALRRTRSGNSVELRYLSDYAEHDRILRNQDAVRDFLLDAVPQADDLLRSPDEMLYLSLVLSHCLPDGNEEGKYDSHTLAAAEKLVTSALEQVRSNYHVNFFQDQMLIRELTVHVAANYNGYLLGLREDNPLLGELRRTYPSSYYYSQQLAACISQSTGRVLSAETTGFITMFFAAAQERLNHEHSWRVAVVCENGFGTAALLKTKLEMQYENIRVEKICSWLNAESLSPANIDLIVSGVSAHRVRTDGIPVVQLSPFLNEDDRQRLNAVLNQLTPHTSVRSLSGPDMFFIIDKPRGKDNVLRFVCERLRRQGVLTEAETENLFEREKLVSTEIAFRVAMPHCMVSGRSFFAFALLRTPLPWGKSDIRLIVVAGMHEGDLRMRGAIEQLITFIQNDRLVDRALDCESWEALMQCMGP